MDVERLVLVIKFLKETKSLVVTLLVKVLKLWSGISPYVRFEFLVDVYTARECGSFLNFIHECVVIPIPAKFPFVGTLYLSLSIILHF